MSAPGELVLSQDEVGEFADVMLSEDYARDERDYKVAVHEVMSRLLAPDTLSGSEFPRLLSDFFERKLDLAEIGIEGDVAARVDGCGFRRSSLRDNERLHQPGRRPLRGEQLHLGPGCD